MQTFIHSPGLYLSFKALRGDLKTVREENPHLVSATTFKARKMGFPEIILPGDVRNDLYLTVLQAEFARGGVKTGGNIQVRMKSRSPIVFDDLRIFSSAIARRRQVRTEMWINLTGANIPSLVCCYRTPPDIR